jgi:RNA polymerase sigma factor (sigma-70 family)
MTHRTLQTVLRKLAETGPPAADADLLRRFAADRDEAAFALLVQRHGRLVWAVCRHLTRSDAEADDAFQATFLVLLRNAGKVREAGKLSAWLHGVAYRVCSKARQSAKRRTTREAMTAKPERNGAAVPDSVWDRALAAVHEEVAKLPDTLRVPFVLCCLEGKGQTEAAEQLGWKLGTLSGRLTRAKDAVLAKLDARGLTLGAVAAVSLSVPPAAISAKAAALGQVGFAVPGSILQLSQGVIGMSVNQVKLLAAGLLVACGLGVSGTAWVASAGAQTAPNKESAEQRVKRLEDELAKAKKEAAEKTERTPDTAQKYEYYTTQVTRVRKKSPTTFQTAKWEYEFVDMAETFDAANLALFLQEREKAGWEFLGSSALAKGGGVPMWLFRRPVKAVTPPVNTLSRPKEVKPLGVPLMFTDSRPLSKLVEYAYPKPLGETSKPADPTAKPDDAVVLEAQIKTLQDRLAEVKKSSETTVMIDYTKFGIRDGKLLTRLIVTLAEEKFGKGALMARDAPDGSVLLRGTKEVTDWAEQTVKMLTDK